jgi:putative drug exporter of the RND superfamily
VPPSSRFARLAHWCATHRKITFLSWIVVLIATQAIGHTVGQKQISSVRLPGTEAQRAYDLLAKHNPTANGDSDQLVFRARTGTLAAHKPRIDAALAKVRANSEVAAVSSPLAQGGQLSADRRIGVASVTYKGSVDDADTGDLKAVQAAAFTARSPALQVEHGGPGGEAVRYLSSGGPSEGVGILAAAVVLIITFGSLVAAGIPLLTALFALGSTLGCIYLISHVVDTPDFAAQLATLIGLGVGIDYALFVLTRYRSEVAHGRDRLRAIEVASDTAGRTVFFAACTVIIALLGMLLLGLSFLHGVAVGAALAVLLTMVGALTLLPALLMGAGNWIDRLHLRLPFSARRRRRAAAAAAPAAPAEAAPTRREGAGWARWSAIVQRRPWLAAGVALAVLLALSAPALGMRLGSSDASVDPAGSTTRAAYNLIADGFGPGINGPFLLATKLPSKGDAGAAQRIAAAAKADRGIKAVAAPRLSKDGQVATITAFPKTGPQDQATTDTLNRLRDDVLPPAERATGATVEVGGLTASQEDFTRVVASKLPVFIGAVVILSALLLLAVFRSVFIPLKAAVMNLLSIGAALGVVTAIFQNGVAAGALGIGTGPIESFVPVMVFAIVFGLSMDYEIFLISRVHEEWERTGDASRAVGRGLATTGKVITAAASIMVVVFASFALGDDRIIKLFGLGLASAILLDALVIRCLLVPALMELVGRRAWWLPAWLDRVMPRLALEHPPEAAPTDPFGERVPETV